MQAIGTSMKKLCQYSLAELQDMLIDMQPVLDHNYHLFYDQKFIQSAWDEMASNLLEAAKQI